MPSTYACGGLVACALAIVIALSAPAARAGTVPHVLMQQAVGNCQAALPVYDAMLRKRPLAIVNEGSANAYISCALPGEMNTGIGGVIGVEFGFTNYNPEPVAVTCTLVNGDRAGAPTFTRTANVTADPVGVYAIGFSSEIHNGGQDFSPVVSASCVVPPNVGLVTTYRHTSPPATP